MGVFGAVVGAIGGAAAGGISSYLLTKKNAEAYKEYAKDIRKAAQKYSGQNAYNAMQNAGMQEANIVNHRNLEAQAAQAPSNMTNKAANAANLQGSYSQGYNLGSQNQKTALDAAYNADTAKAQQALNQANIDYKAGTAATQAAMNTAGGLASLYGQVKGMNGGSKTPSDERIKEYDNHSGLPKADVDDALRRIESINYKYKDGTGLDDKEHTGVTAQSVENTAFDGMVSENENGVKQLDKQMMLEAVLAGIASLRKELDELEGSGNDKITSDERCKEAETAIESNPEQAAQQLPQGSPIQQEAVQATQNGPQAEVNNKVIDDYVNTINKQFGEGIKYLKPNYETLKNMPSFDFNKPETLTNSDWWKEQLNRTPMYDSPTTKNKISMQPGFDYDIDAIKADYPEAYLQGESPEELKRKAHDALIEDAYDAYSKNGDLSILEDYIKEHGESPLSDMYFDNEHDSDEYKLYSALTDKYPNYFNKTDLRDLQKVLLDREYEENKYKPTMMETILMNEGLSEDDPDYFGSDERIKKPIAKTGRRINA